MLQRLISRMRFIIASAIERTRLVDEHENCSFWHIEGMFIRAAAFAAIGVFSIRANQLHIDSSRCSAHIATE